MPPTQQTARRLTVNASRGFARNPEYTVFAPVWAKCRDAAAGQDAIHAAEKTYLPRPSGMDQQDYPQYLRRAMFYNGMGRTTMGLTGTVMRKPVTIDYPDAQRDSLQTIGVSGESVEELIARTVRAQLTLGRVGHLVDAGRDDGRPFVSEYEAESILNWHEERIDGQMQLTFVVLHEQEWVQGGAPKYETKRKDKFRVLRLGFDPAVEVVDESERNESGEVVRSRSVRRLAQGFTTDDVRVPFYFQEIWVFAVDVNGDETDELVLEEVITPKKALGGRLWTEIPFQFTNVGSDEPSPEKPPLLDLVNVNLSHYLNSADLEWGRHWTALPTPWVAGGDPTEAPTIGSSTAWVMPSSDAKVGMLEFTGAGLGHIQTGMEHKERLMAILGSRLLEDNKTGVEAAEAIKLRLTGDSAVLAAIAFHASKSWTKILMWFWEWSNLETLDIQVQLNTDFNPARLPAGDMAVLMQSLQAGMIDFETWFYNLEKGEVLRPGTTLQEFEASVQKGLPGGPTPPGDTEQELLGDDAEDAAREDAADDAEERAVGQ